MPLPAIAIPLMLAAGSAAAGAYSQKKARDQQQSQFDADEENRRKEQQYAWATGQNPTTRHGQVPTASPWGGALQGAFAGASQGMNINAMNAQQKLIDAQTKQLEREAVKYGQESGITMNKSVFVKHIIYL